MYSIDEEREYLSNNLQLFFERDITGGGSEDSKPNDAQRANRVFLMYPARHETGPLLQHLSLAPEGQAASAV